MSKRSRSGSITRLQKLIGAIKDRASLSKAAMFSCTTNRANPNAISIVKSTTHDYSAPPPDKHLSALLSSSSRASRAAAASTVHALMSRLHRTRDAAVALKCLIVVHLVVKRGPFILQDQVSVYPWSGGRNYLNMSGFRDDRTHAKWVLSAFVRWHAGYVEQLLSTSRELGFFVGALSNSTDKDKEEERASSSSVKDLLREARSMTDLVEEICQTPDYLHGDDEAKKLISEVVGLVGSDYLSLVNDLSLRLTELQTRDSLSQFDDSVQLARVLTRLERCKEKLATLFGYEKVSVQTFWSLVDEMKEKLGYVRDDDKRLMRSTESARFGERVVSHGDSVRFSSSRFSSTKIQGL
uniref:ENTH domain-containing protein n=1 Tax=Kalanchoe fedtschenkoi TaxID=63787 RepID=A0A7N0TII0_KALFE